MDFCPVCGLAVEIRADNGQIQALCRNPQCVMFGKVLENQEKKEGENENGI